MAYTETKTTGYGQRIGQSFKNVLGGIFLFLAASGLLWWNEGNFVKTRAALEEAQGAVRTLDDIGKVDAANNGQLVHATGLAETKDMLEDPFFEISVNAISLGRTVEYYQWVEEKSTTKKNNTGGSETKTTTYTYKQEWSDKQIKSAEFANPDAQQQKKNTVIAPELEDLKVQAANVAFGAYRLPKFLINSINNTEAFNVTLSDEKVAGLNKRFAPSAPPPGGGVEAEAPAEPPKMVHVNGDSVYLGLSPEQPRIGDIRVKFTKTPASVTVSLIAKVVGESFEEYVSKNGRSVSMLSVGTHSMENMFGQAHAGNAMLTWILRAVGIFGVCIGLMLVMAPLSTLASVIPFLGNLVGAGTTLFGLLAGLAWSFLVIALAWLFYRPLIGILILAAAVASICFLVSKVRSIRSAKAQANG